jgi:hypothetical protein
MYIDAKTGDRDQFIYLFIFMFCWPYISV